jgi:hypothetical protein
MAAIGADALINSFSLFARPLTYEQADGTQTAASGTITRIAVDPVLNSAQADVTLITMLTSSLPGIEPQRYDAVYDGARRYTIEEVIGPYAGDTPIFWKLRAKL